MIDNLYRKRTSEKKRCQLFENCANFACVQFSQSLIFATIGWFVRLNIRFASLTRRAFVAGAPNQFAPWSREAGMCLLDTMASMCPTMVFVGHGINKCLRGYAPGMHECLLTDCLLTISYPWLTCVKSNSLWTNFADNGKIHTCMYNVCTLYTTAVGVILARQLAWCLHRNEYDIWCNVCWTLYVQCMYVVCTRDEG